MMLDEQKRPMVSIRVHEVVFGTLSRNRDGNFFWFFLAFTSYRTYNKLSHYSYIKKDIWQNEGWRTQTRFYAKQ